MKNKEFTLTMTCYTHYDFLQRVCGFRMGKVAEFIAEDLSYEFNNCDEFNTMGIKCSCRPKGRISYGIDYILFMFSIITDCQNDDMASELKDAIYEAAYEYIDGDDVEIEVYDSFA